MKKVFILGLLVCLLVAIPYMTACAQSSKPIEVIYAGALPAQSPPAKVFKKWGDMIEEKSGGRVKIIYYWSNTLLTTPQAVKGVRKGVADVTSTFAGLEDYMPLSYNIMFLPFMGYPSMAEGAKIYEQLYDKFEAIRDEYSGLKRLYSRCYAAIQIHTSKKVIKVPSDLKGVKIACSTSGSIGELVKVLGGAPIQVHVADMNMALNTGVAEGWIQHFPAVQVFGAMPMLPYHTMLGEGGISMGVESMIMNFDSFNRLPDDIKKIVEEVSSWCGEELMKTDEGVIKWAMGEAKKLNHTFTSLTPEEIKLWSEFAKPLHQKWITQMEAKGKPAKAIYQESKRLIKEYKN
jgi:TRAP-type C4-dicarboxylate transport system substrate-binding protein